MKNSNTKKFFYLSLALLSTNVFANVSNTKNNSKNTVVKTLTKEDLKVKKSPFKELTDKELDFIVNKVGENKTVEVSLIELVQKVITSNKRVISLREELKRAKLDLKTAMNNRLPTVDYSARVAMDQVSKTVYNKAAADQEYVELVPDKDTFNEVGQIKQGVYMNMDLYKGGSLYLERELAKNYISNIETKLFMEIEKEVKKIIDIYLELSFISGKKEISLNLLKTLEDFMLNANEKFKGGLISKGDLNSIKALFYEQKSVYIDLSSEEYQKESLYDFLIGKELNYLRPQKLIGFYDLEQFDDLMLKLNNNSSLSYSNLTFKKLLLDKEMTKTKFKPNVKAALNYTDLTRYPTNYLESDRDNTGTLNALVEFSYSLFNKGKDKIGFEKSLISLRKQKNEIKLLKEELEYKLRKSFLTVDALKRNNLNYEIQLKNINDMLKNYYDQYQGGKNLVKIILDGEKNKNRVENKIIENNETYYKEYYNIKLIVGDLLKEFDLDINKLYLDKQFKEKPKKQKRVVKSVLDYLYSKLKIDVGFRKFIKFGEDKIENKNNSNKTETETKKIEKIKRDEIPSKLEEIRKQLKLLKVEQNDNGLEKEDIMKEIGIAKKEMSISKEEILKQINLYKK